MKIIASALFALLLFTFANSELYAQKTKTFILLRHAEKATADGVMNTDPELSAAGKERATRLVKKVKKYKPKAIYSTNFIRTRSTVQPLAEKRKLQTQIYDHKKLPEFYQMIMDSKDKKIVVVGHNVTVPALANMLIKEEKYKTLDESEYDKIWVIKVKKGKMKKNVMQPDKIEAKVITY